MANIIRSKTLAGGLGLFTHFLMNHGEWEQRSHIIIPAGPILFGALVATVYLIDPRVGSIFAALKVAATAAAYYLGTLTASILIYRAFFHRLRQV